MALTNQQLNQAWCAVMYVGMPGGAIGNQMTNQVIKVNPKAKANFRPNSARAAYWQAIQQYNGKTVAAFTKACMASPPSTPQRGKLKGKAEPTAGWVSWFNRNGYISLTNS